VNVVPKPKNVKMVEEKRGGWVSKGHSTSLYGVAFRIDEGGWHEGDLCTTIAWTTEFRRLLCLFANHASELKVPAEFLEMCRSRNALCGFVLTGCDVIVVVWRRLLIHQFA